MYIMYITKNNDIFSFDIYYDKITQLLHITNFICKCDIQNEIICEFEYNEKKNIVSINKSVHFLIEEVVYHHFFKIKFYQDQHRECLYIINGKLSSREEIIVITDTLETTVDINVDYEKVHDTVAPIMEKSFISHDSINELVDKFIEIQPAVSPFIMYDIFVNKKWDFNFKLIIDIFEDKGLLQNYNMFELRDSYIMFTCDNNLLSIIDLSNLANIPFGNFTLDLINETNSVNVIIPQIPYSLGIHSVIDLIYSNIYIDITFYSTAVVSLNVRNKRSFSIIKKTSIVIDDFSRYFLSKYFFMYLTFPFILTIIVIILIYVLNKLHF